MSDTSTPATPKISKTWIVLGVVGILLVLIISTFSGTYNTLVGKDEAAKAQWANVSSSYQRRLDLIPNLVSTVQGSAKFEKSTLEAVVTARANATKTTIDINDAQAFAEYQAQQGAITQALSRLIAVTENYPDLKSTAQFEGLMTQLEGTENRINTERNRYNEVVQDFNVTVRRFPTNLIAGFLGFSIKPLFEADKGAEKAPKVEF